MQFQVLLTVQSLNLKYCYTFSEQKINPTDYNRRISYRPLQRAATASPGSSVLSFSFRVRIW